MHTCVSLCDPAVLNWAINGGGALPGWPGAPYPAAPVGALDPDRVLVIDDRNSILVQRDFELLQMLFGCPRLVSGNPNAGGGNPGYTRTWASLRQFQVWDYVIVVGRSIPAGIPIQAALPSLADMILLVDKMSRLWSADSQWARAAMRAAADVVRFSIEACATGNGMGGNSPARNAAAAAAAHWAAKP